jgi:hypothetical protein
MQLMTRLSIVAKIHEATSFGFKQVWPVRFTKGAKQDRDSAPWQFRASAEAEPTLVSAWQQFRDRIIARIVG